MCSLATLCFIKTLRLGLLIVVKLIFVVGGGGQEKVVEAGNHIARILHQASLHEAVVQQLLRHQGSNLRENKL